MRGSVHRVSAEEGLARLPGGSDAGELWGGRAQTAPCAWHTGGVTPVQTSSFCLPLFPVRAPDYGAHLLSLCCFAELVHKLAHGHQH